MKKEKKKKLFFETERDSLEKQFWINAHFEEKRSILDPIWFYLDYLVLTLSPDP